MLSRQVGVPSIVVYLNKVDQVDDDELIELFEMEITELLEEKGFMDCPIVKGSALAALEGRDDEIGVETIKELMQAVDDFIPQPERDENLPFLMPVEDVFSIEGRGTVVTGRVETGKIVPNDEVEILGLGESRKVVCTSLEMFRKSLPFSVTILSSGIKFFIPSFIPNNPIVEK